MPAPSKLAIATSSLQRLIKEETTYHAELTQHESRIAKMEADTTDEEAEYKVKQEKRAMEETKAIIPTLQSRIHQAIGNLETQLNASKGQSSTSADEITKGEDLLKEVKK